MLPAMLEMAPPIGPARRSTAAAAKGGITNPCSSQSLKLIGVLTSIWGWGRERYHRCQPVSMEPRWSVARLECAAESGSLSPSGPFFRESTRASNKHGPRKHAEFLSGPKGVLNMLSPNFRFVSDFWSPHISSRNAMAGVRKYLGTPERQECQRNNDHT